MNIKAETFKQISLFINKEWTRINEEIRQNKYKFKRLEEEQTILKRKRAELADIYNYCLKRKALEEDFNQEKR